VRLRSRGSRGGREGFSNGASSDIRFYKERAGILDGSRGGWTTAGMEEHGAAGAALLPTWGGG